MKDSNIIKVDFAKGSRQPDLPAPVQELLDWENPLLLADYTLEPVAYRLEGDTATDVVFLDEDGTVWSRTRREDGTAKLTTHSQRVQGALKRCNVQLREIG